MGFPIGAALLDAMVLSVVNRHDTYGYEITTDIKKAVELSDSTLYPVLRRLQKNGYLITYDKEYLGRNRRYYHISEAGKIQLEQNHKDWETHKRLVDSILLTVSEEDENEQT